MRKWLRLIGFCGVLAAVALSSCKTRRDLSEDKPDRSIRYLESVYASMAAADTYEWYTGKARFRITTPDVRLSATVHLRMVRDSAIWATVDKFGFEVARVLITPDSVLVIDRLNQEYTREALSVFLIEYGVQIGFADLQKAFSGGMINIAPQPKQILREEHSNVFVVDNRRGISGTHWVSFDRPPRLVKSAFIDRDSRTLVLENSRWQAVDADRIMPFGRFLEFSDADGKTEIELTFSSIEVDQPATLPFSIPPNYANAR